MPKFNFSDKLKNPVVLASGTAGYGAELSAYGDLSLFGAITVKSLSPFSYDGNVAPRVWPTKGGMLNSVGLANPGIEGWINTYLPQLLATRANLVVSVWGKVVKDYVEVARTISNLSLEYGSIIAIELNLSCPNLEGGKELFCENETSVIEIVSSVKRIVESKIEVWVKLAPSLNSIVGVSKVALDNGADSLTVSNTHASTLYKYGKLINCGLSGPALHPVSLRAVLAVREKYPNVHIVGTGGIFNYDAAIDFFAAGANAVGIGSLCFVSPKKTFKIAEKIMRLREA